MSASEKGESSTATGAKESRDPEESDKAKEVTPDCAAEGMQQAQRLAKENPMPLAFVGVFLAGVVFGRLLSR